MKKIALLITLSFFILSTGYSTEIGKTASNFTLDKLQGGNGMLSDYNGQVVFVFLFGHGCPYCIGAAEAIKLNILDEFKDDPNFMPIGIDVWNGSKTQVQGFKSGTGLDMTMYLKGRDIAKDWGTTYDRLMVIGPDGKFVYRGGSRASNTITATKSAIAEALNNVSTAIKEPKVKVLNQNYPNPFNVRTVIPFQLDEASNVSIELLDLSGKKVKTIAEAYYPTGDHQVVLNRNGLKSGIYFYKITAGEKTESRLMTIK